MNGRWQTSVHEAGHVVLALLAGFPVTGATVREDHSGWTEFLGAPWPSCVTSFGGLVAERLILAPEEVDARRSRVDMENAHLRAMKFCEWSESRRVVRRLGPAPEPEVVRPALDAAARADVEALVREIGEKLRPRREARVLRLVSHAARIAHERLSRNVVTVRTIAGPLADYGFLDGQQLLELFAEGRRRQIEDDLEWRKRA